MSFDWNTLSDDDRMTAVAMIGGERDPDIVIAPDGKPYLFRWHIYRDQEKACMYFHVQIASDTDRALHDHPWDNTSLILAGGYVEHLSPNPGGKLHDTQEFERKPGDMIFRKAEHAHRLILPKATPYTMSLFTCGPVRRDWGFWTIPHGASAERQWKWVPAHELIEARGNLSVQKGAK